MDYIDNSGNNISEDSKHYDDFEDEYPGDR